ncbi:MAG: hypothetical protein R3B70_08550 [Polyangiaceae bacterium]
MAGLIVSRSALALGMGLMLGCAGCAQVGGQLVGAAIELSLRAVFAAASTRPGYSEPVPQTEFTECEMARGRWREVHQDEADDLPPQYQCGPNGEWPPEAEKIFDETAAELAASTAAARPVSPPAARAVAAPGDREPAVTGAVAKRPQPGPDQK